MTQDTLDRRRLLQLSLAGLPTWMALAAATQADPTHIDDPKARAAGDGSEHDFDFFFGSWKVAHRRLKKRLANNNEWEEFEGATRCESILGGLANFNDSISYRASGASRGMGLRAYDAKTGAWADWYLSSGDPTKIDTPGVGRFTGKIGTFLSDDTFEGRPIKVRGIFTSIKPSLASWEQAFSADEGRTWETNWVMRYTRARSVKL